MVRESFSNRSSSAEGSEAVAGEGPAVDWGGDTGCRWLRVADKVEAQLAPVSDVLFAAAGLAAGERVLDAGCGLGSTTRRAAETVGPSGGVTGLDIAAEMIDEARGIPAPSGAPIEWIVADAQTVRLPADSHDAVISRFGVLFFDDPVAAFANLAGSTRPGGRLHVTVWQWRDRSPLLQLALDVASSVAAAHGHPIDVGEPGDGPFAYGDPAFVRPILGDAGWVEVDVTEHVLDMLLFGPGTTRPGRWSRSVRACSSHKRYRVNRPPRGILCPAAGPMPRLGRQVVKAKAGGVDVEPLETLVRVRAN